MGRQLVTFDWALKRLLRSKANFEILEGFLSELLKEDIKILEVLESEGNKKEEDDKYNRVDLKVRNSKGEIIIIEVQYNRQHEFFHRILYGTAKSIVEHICSGEAYSEVVKVISVNILHFELGFGKDYVYHGTTKFIGLHTKDELELNEEQKRLFKCEKVEKIFPEYYLIKVNNFDDVAKDSLDEWIYFLKNGEIKDNFSARGIKKAKEELEVMQLSKEERILYERYVEDRRNRESIVINNYRAGKLKGIEEGKEEGLKEGIKKGKLETAKNMLKKGLDINLVSEITGLSIEEIDGLK